MCLPARRRPPRHRRLPGAPLPGRVHGADAARVRGRRQRSLLQRVRGGRGRLHHCQPASRPLLERRRGWRRHGRHRVDRHADRLQGVRRVHVHRRVGDLPDAGAAALRRVRLHALRAAQHRRRSSAPGLRPRAAAPRDRHQRASRDAVHLQHPRALPPAAQPGRAARRQRGARDERVCADHVWHDGWVVALRFGPCARGAAEPAHELGAVVHALRRRRVCSQPRRARRRGPRWPGGDGRARERAGPAAR
mmetsp:Transcript_3015/g.8881  ORF Transcript_3015/g.8881 Transcript_3015/m.8881 type:complete len:249 (-) Transcript_3015:2673-3419(-)